MSYLRAHKVSRSSAIPLSDVTHVADPDLDTDLDFETLQFVLAIIGEIDELDEGVALVIWKEIF